MSSAVTNALSHGPGPLAVDGLHHLIKLTEARSRQDVWRRRERELVMEGDAFPTEAPAHRERRAPYPRGPVERLGDRMAPASLIGAGGMLAFTRDPGRAADLMLATMPKAACQGREAFAAVLDRELCRQGVVPMDATALRRLDRIDIVVIDSSVLCATKPRVLSAVATDSELDDRAVWQQAERLVAAQAEDRRPSGRWRLEPARDAAPGDADGPSAMTLDLVDASDRTRDGGKRRWSAHNSARPWSPAGTARWSSPPPGLRRGPVRGGRDARGQPVLRMHPAGPVAWGVVGASSATATAAGTAAPALPGRLGMGTS